MAPTVGGSIASPVSSADKGSPRGKSEAHAMTAELLCEAAEIESRLREHILQLLEPTIHKHKLLEMEVAKMKNTADTAIADIADLRRQHEAQESLRGAIEGFGVTLAEWDRERREHEQLVGDRASLQDIEINELRRALAGNSGDVATNAHALKSLGENVKDCHKEMTEMRRFCTERVDLARDKLAKLRDEFETRVMAVESAQCIFKDAATVQGMDVNRVKTEVGRVSRELTEAQAGVADLWRSKVSVTCLEEQQQNFSEFACRLDAQVAGLGKQFGTLVHDVKGHLETATEVVARMTATQMEDVRASQKEEVRKVEDIKKELSAFLERQRDHDEQLFQRVVQAMEEVRAEFAELRVSTGQQARKLEAASAEISVEVKQARKATRELKDAGTDKKTGGGVGSDVLAMIVESDLLSAALDMQDDLDRQSIALFGLKPGGQLEGPAAEEALAAGGRPGGGAGRTCALPELDGTGGWPSARSGLKHKVATPRRRKYMTAEGIGDVDAEAAATPRRRTVLPEGGGAGDVGADHIVTLDHRCLSCSGSQATVLAGFKLACLQYRPSPVEYQHVAYSRSELIRTRMDLLKQVREQLRQVV